MRFITKPRVYVKIQKQRYRRVLDILKTENFSLSQEECEKKIVTLKAMLAYKSENPDGIKRYSEERAYRADIAYAYGYLLAAATGWKAGWIVLREKKTMEDGFVVASPQNEYWCDPTYLMLMERTSPQNLFVDVYERIKNGQLPPSEPDKFLDIIDCFYPQKEEVSFYPLEDDTMAQLKTTIAGGLALAGCLKKEDENTFFFEAENAVKSIEDCLLEYRADYEKSRKKPKTRSIITMLSTAYGECICQACGYAWGKAWLEDCYGDLVIYSPDKKYYMKPANIIRKFLSGKIAQGELWRYCTRIQTNNLPPPECWRPEEIT